MDLFPYKVVITTDVTLGSILTSNATDGKKTIYFRDVIGVQYKRSGLTLGYLQFETASGLMNNKASNLFNENTFTFDESSGKGISELMERVYQCVIAIMDELKR